MSDEPKVSNEHYSSEEISPSIVDPSDTVKKLKSLEESTEEPKKLMYSEVTPDEIVPGVTIEGFPKYNLNAGVINLLPVLGSAITTDQSTIEQLKHERGMVKQIVDSLAEYRPQGFKNGAFTNPRVTILPDGEAVPERDDNGNAIPDTNIANGRIIKFAVERDMNFIKGKVGTTKTIFTFYLSKSGFGLSHSQATDYGGIQKNIDVLVEKSIRTATGVLRKGLLRPTSGGLPSLGKRR